MTREVVVHYWTLIGPAGETAVCQLVRGPRGLEVQCSVDSDPVLRAADVTSRHDGFNVSESWRAGYAAKGWQAPPDTSS